MYEFDRPDWVTIQTIENAHESTVWSVSFSHDGKYLASVGSDSNIKIYEFIPRTETESAKLMLIITYDIENCKWPLYSVSWNCQANFFAVGSGDKKIRIFELKEREKLINLETTVECDDEVNNVSWSRNEPKLLVAALDNGQAAVYKLH
uniref:WD_REPEATS_REGION domain-containing protein n=1 Tax=Rhabditophanes sp. KR3021 TaxID=114890 RepID=A0AC35TLX5_9BILA